MIRWLSYSNPQGKSKVILKRINFILHILLALINQIIIITWMTHMVIIGWMTHFVFNINYSQADMMLTNQRRKRCAIDGIVGYHCMHSYHLPLLLCSTRHKCTKRKIKVVLSPLDLCFFQVYHLLWDQYSKEKNILFLPLHSVNRT